MLPTPREIVFESDNVRWMEREVVNTTTKGLFRERTTDRWKEYILDSAFATLATSMLLIGGFARVTITHIDGIAKTRNTPAIVNHQNCKISAEGSGSRIEYMNESGLRDKILIVLESPAAIVAGNSSSTGS